MTTYPIELTIQEQKIISQLLFCTILDIQDTPSFGLDPLLMPVLQSSFKKCSLPFVDSNFLEELAVNTD